MIDTKNAFELYVALKSLDGSYNKYFLFAAENNVDKIEPHFNKYVELEKRLRTESEFIEYEKGIRAIVKEYCEKDDSGEPIVNENGQVKIANDRIEEYNKMVTEYDNLNQDVLSKLEELKKTMNDMISTELDIELDLVELSNFPDTIDVKVFKQLKIMRK